MRNAKTSRVLRISLGVTLVYIVLLVVAGLRANSLALLSEAGHNLTDFLALLMSWGAVYLQGRPPSARKTFGYHRAGVLAAFVNGITLVLISFYIWFEAFKRLQTQRMSSRRKRISVTSAQKTSSQPASHRIASRPTPCHPGWSVINGDWQGNGG